MTTKKQLPRSLAARHCSDRKRPSHRENHLELLLTEAGRDVLIGRLPDGGRNAARFAHAVRSACGNEPTIRIDGENVDRNDLEHAAAMLIAAHDGVGSTTAIAQTAEIEPATAARAMRHLESKGLVYRAARDQWAVPTTE